MRRGGSRRISRSRPHWRDLHSSCSVTPFTNRRGQIGRLVFKIDIGKLLAVVAAHDKAGIEGFGFQPVNRLCRGVAEELEGLSTFSTKPRVYPRLYSSVVPPKSDKTTHQSSQ